MKRINIYHFLMLLLFCLPTDGWSQQVEEVLDKATQFYKDTKEYKVLMKFSMLRGLSGNEVTESYTATMEKNGDYLKNVILGTSIFMFPNGQIVKDDNNKKITYSKETNLSKMSASFNLTSFLKYYEKSQLLDKGNFWICEMVSTNKNFSQLPYSKVELYIDKDNYHVTKQILYFSKLIPFRSEGDNSIGQDYGRMVIEMEHDFKSNVAIKHLEDFVTVQPSKGMQLKKEYYGYQLVNETQQNN